MADGGGGQHRLYIVIYSVQKKNLAVSEGGGLAGGGLAGFYCMSYFGNITITTSLVSWGFREVAGEIVASVKYTESPTWKQ